MHTLAINFSGKPFNERGDYGQICRGSSSSSWERRRGKESCLKMEKNTYYFFSSLISSAGYTNRERKIKFLPLLLICSVSVRSLFINPNLNFPLMMIKCVTWPKAGGEWINCCLDGRNNRLRTKSIILLGSPSSISLLLTGDWLSRPVVHSFIHIQKLNCSSRIDQTLKKVRSFVRLLASRRWFLSRHLDVGSHDRFYSSSNDDDVVLFSMCTQCDKDSVRATAALPDRTAPL